VSNVSNINLTVFHDAALPPDDFVANCIISFEDLMQSETAVQDLWVRFILYLLYIFLISYYNNISLKPYRLTWSPRERFTSLLS